MSTKSSLVFYEWSIPKSIHIYYDLSNGKHYLETELNRVELPEKIAVKLAEEIKEMREKEEL